MDYEILEDLFFPEETEEETANNGDYAVLSKEEQVNLQQKLSTIKKAVILKSEDHSNGILHALEAESLKITRN